MSRSAFTLIELLMVVIIVGILAAMALPQFSKTTERSYQRQAWDMLQVIYAGERSYFSTNSTFYNPTAGGHVWSAIYMDNPSTATTTYTFSSSDAFATHFTVTATRVGGPLCNNATMTINEQRVRSGGAPDWQACPMALP